MIQKTLILGGCAMSMAAMAANKPNLVVIHTDEHSFRTLSCYQDLLPEEQAFVWGKGVNSTTPNIDRIAKAGAICMNYYCSAPVSTPSRASFITGLYPHATGAWKNGLPIKEDVPTFGTILRDAGYSTSYVGKWHLSKEHEQYEYNVKYDGGFTDNTWMTCGGHAPYAQIKDGKIIDRGISQNRAVKLPKDELVHYTDLYADKTIEIIERDSKKPFCVMVSIPDPHTPDYATAPYNTMYDHLNPQKPMTMTETHKGERPSWAGKGDKNGGREFDPAPLKQYFGMVKHIDDAVGRILTTLDEKGLTENTIVVFTADHGDMFFEHDRMNKGVPYEASARVPFVISYPGTIRAGKVITSNYVNVDFVPTILSLMGVETKAKFHGTNTASDFTSKSKKVTAPRFTHFSASSNYWSCAVEGKYKLILDKAEKPWLFDLEKDPFELINVVNEPENKEVVARMTKMLLDRLADIDAPNKKFNTTGI